MLVPSGIIRRASDRRCLSRCCLLFWSSLLLLLLMLLTLLLLLLPPHIALPYLPLLLPLLFGGSSVSADASIIWLRAPSRSLCCLLSSMSTSSVRSWGKPKFGARNPLSACFIEPSSKSNHGLKWGHECQILTKFVVRMYSSTQSIV